MKRFVIGVLLGTLSVIAAAQSHVPGQVLVKFAPKSSTGASSTHEARTNALIGATTVYRQPQIGWTTVRLPAGMSVEQGVRWYQRQSGVLHAEPNFVKRKLQFVPNDPLYPQQYALQRISAPMAWTRSRGNSSITIAILDTGVDLDHPDLASKLVPGYDFANNDAVPQDADGHGSHCAGIAAAVTNNNVGIAGLAINSRIMPIQVLSDFGFGSVQWINAGIIFAADNGAKVINLSLGGYGRSESMRDAVIYALNRGALSVAAAGNDNVSQRLYPAGFEEVIAVGSTNQDDQKSGFSNFGRDWVDVAAPGSGILSTVPYGSGYDVYSGTSMASPYVAGLAGLLFSSIPGATPNLVRQRIESTTDPVGDWVRFGRINAFRALPANAATFNEFTIRTIGMLEGRMLSGGATQLRTSDNQYLNSTSQFVNRLGHVSSVRIVFRSTMAPSRMVEPTLRVEAASIARTSTSLFVYNHRTRRYDYFGSFAHTGGDLLREVKLPTARVGDFFDANQDATVLIRTVNAISNGRAVQPIQVRHDQVRFGAFPRLD